MKAQGMGIAIGKRNLEKSTVLEYHIYHITDYNQNLAESSVYSVANFIRFTKQFGILELCSREAALAFLAVY